MPAQLLQSCPTLYNPMDCSMPVHVYGIIPGRILELIAIFSSRAYNGILCTSVIVIVQLLSCVWFFVTLWTAACQASLSFTISWSRLKLMSIESAIPPTFSSSLSPFSCCPQSFSALKSFPASQVFASVAKVLELQFQHQSFQWIFSMHTHTKKTPAKC